MEFPPFIGRQAELDALVSAYADPGTRLAIITGEAGGGKTRLAFEFLRTIDAARFVTVQCFLLAGAPVSYAGLEAVLGTSPKRHRNDGEHFDDGQLARFARWTSELRAHGDSTGRGMLVLEDIHWADQTTLAFLSYLTRSPGDLFVLATRRTVGERVDPEVAETLADILRLPSAVHIPLQRLSVMESEKLVSTISSDEAVSSRRRELAERCEGNPYLLIELAEAGGELPHHVIEILLARTRRLDSLAMCLLQLIAVAGGGIEEAVLAAAAGVDGTAYSDAVRHAVGSGVLTYDRTVYRFRHALTQEALERQMSPAERRERHRSLANALEASTDRGDASARALHWWAAGDRRRAAPAMVEAAREASSHYAHAEAWEHYKRALGLMDDGPERSIDLIIEAAEAARWATNMNAAIELVSTAARALQEPHDRARLLERLGRYLWDSGDLRRSSSALEEAAELTKDSSNLPLAALVSAALAHNLLSDGSYADSARAAKRAVERSSQLGLPIVQADAEITLGVAQVLLGDESGLSMIQKAVDEHAEMDYNVACRGYANLLFVLEYLGRTTAAGEVAAEGLKLLGGRGLHGGAGATFMSNATGILILRGRITECAKVLDDLTSTLVLEARAQYLWLNRASVALIADDTDLAERCLARAADLDKVNDPWVVVDLAITRAETLAARNRSGEALELLEETLAQVKGHAPSLIARLCRTAFRVLADGVGHWSNDGNVLDVNVHMDRLADCMPVGISSELDAKLRLEQATARAEMARVTHNDDPGHWAALVRGWADLDRPLDQSYCGYRHAVSLADQRQLTAAALAASEAYRMADSAGAFRLGKIIDDFARRARLKLAPATETEPSSTRQQRPMGLTERELEVLRLLATEGLTNRELAGRLFIAERTATVHVSAVLRKLGVANRLQAAAIAKQLQL